MPLTREQEAVAESIKSLMDLLETLNNIEKQIEDNPTNLHNIVNVTWLSRKCKDVLQILEKKFNKIEEKAATYGAGLLMHVEDHKFSNEFGTISNNSEFYVKHPTGPSDTNPEENQEFLNFIQALAKEAPHALRPHYKTLMEEIRNQLVAGNQIPFGLDAKRISGMIYKLRLTSKKEL